MHRSAVDGATEDFDYIIVSHNGKCAERLMREAGVDRLHRILKTKFSCAPPPGSTMQLSSLWVLCLLVKGSLSLPFEGAFIKGNPDLCWASDNTMKLGQGSDKEYEAWTLISSRSYGSQNKCPQENVPKQVSEKVTSELISAFESACGLPQGSVRPTHTLAQLWGAAVPMNVLSAPGLGRFSKYPALNIQRFHPCACHILLGPASLVQ
jgi:hypothetical protein